MEGPGASGLGLGSALWPGERWISGGGRSKSTQKENDTRVSRFGFIETFTMTCGHV